MSHESVYASVSRHVPCCHMEWPNNTAPPPPFACYLLDYSRDVCADDAPLYRRLRWNVELYEKGSDPELEDALEASLRSAFGAVRRDENWIENDNLLQVVYTFYEIEGESDG